MSEDASSSQLDSRIYEHISGFSSKRVPLEVARNGLMAAGWTEQEIDAALLVRPYTLPPREVLNPDALVLAAESDAGPSKGVKVAIIIVAVLICALGLYAVIHSSQSAAPKTSGVITATDCLLENGTVSGLRSQICQIGTVQLTIISQ